VGKVIADQSVSLDGFSAGPNVGMGNGMGDGGEELHSWMFAEGGRTRRDGAASQCSPLMGSRPPTCAACQAPSRVLRPRRRLLSSTSVLRRAFRTALIVQQAAG